MYISNLAKYKLLHKESRKYEGYRLTYLGYDFLAIHSLVKKGVINSVGRQIGVGKESDVFEVTKHPYIASHVTCHKKIRAWSHVIVVLNDQRHFPPSDLKPQVMNDEGEVLALKLHRLGRTSFRAVKSKRDYLQHRTSFRYVCVVCSSAA